MIVMIILARTKMIVVAPQKNSTVLKEESKGKITFVSQVHDTQ